MRRKVKSSRLIIDKHTMRGSGRRNPKVTSGGNPKGPHGRRWDARMEETRERYRPRANITSPAIGVVRKRRHTAEDIAAAGKEHKGRASGRRNNPVRNVGGGKRVMPRLEPATPTEPLQTFHPQHDLVIKQRPGTIDLTKDKPIDLRSIDLRSADEIEAKLQKLQRLAEKLSPSPHTARPRTRSTGQLPSPMPSLREQDLGNTPEVRNFMLRLQSMTPIERERFIRDTKRRAGREMPALPDLPATPRGRPQRDIERPPPTPIPYPHSLASPYRTVSQYAGMSPTTPYPQVLESFRGGSPLPSERRSRTAQSIPEGLLEHNARPDRTAGISDYQHPIPHGGAEEGFLATPRDEVIDMSKFHQDLGDVDETNITERVGTRR